MSAFKYCVKCGSPFKSEKLTVKMCPSCGGKEVKYEQKNHLTGEKKEIKKDCNGNVSLKYKSSHVPSFFGGNLMLNGGFGGGNSLLTIIEEPKVIGFKEETHYVTVLEEQMILHPYYGLVVQKVPVQKKIVKQVPIYS